MTHETLGPSIDLAVNWPPTGTYVLAVSGGADSMVLLDVMATAAPPARRYQLVVAHVDHGIRPDSIFDRQLVAAAAGRYGLQFEHVQFQLGAQASEAAARAARWLWLEKVRAAHHAQAVVTAHHQDDLIETSLLNLARGASHAGLAPMQAGGILRPLLSCTRLQLRRYTSEHAVTWRDDPTNLDLSNPRNWLRHELLPHATAAFLQKYPRLIAELAKLSASIDTHCQRILEGLESDEGYQIPAAVLRQLSLAEVCEILAYVTRTQQVEASERLIRELGLFAKTAAPGRRRAVSSRLWLAREARCLIITWSVATHS